MVTRYFVATTSRKYFSQTFKFTLSVVLCYCLQQKKILTNRQLIESTKIRQLIDNFANGEFYEIH